jgi:hypothetical protein
MLDLLEFAMVSLILANNCAFEGPIIKIFFFSKSS